MGYSISCGAALIIAKPNDTLASRVAKLVPSAVAALRARSSETDCGRSPVGITHNQIRNHMEIDWTGGLTYSGDVGNYAPVGKEWRGVLSDAD